MKKALMFAFILFTSLNLSAREIDLNQVPQIDSLCVQDMTDLIAGKSIGGFSFVDGKYTEDGNMPSSPPRQFSRTAAEVAANLMATQLGRNENVVISGRFIYGAGYFIGIVIGANSHGSAAGDDESVYFYFSSLRSSSRQPLLVAVDDVGDGMSSGPVYFVCQQ